MGRLDERVATEMPDPIVLVVDGDEKNVGWPPKRLTLSENQQYCR